VLLISGNLKRKGLKLNSKTEKKVSRLKGKEIMRINSLKSLKRLKFLNGSLQKVGY
jgi:hypothetical protein